MENQQIQIIQNKQTSLSNKKPQNNWTTSLVGILPVGNGLILTKDETTNISISLTRLDFEVALQSEKLFQLKNSIGEANILKSVYALLKMFSDATKVNKPLSISEIIMCADFIIKKYTHESIADFALALKDGIFGGHKFYGSVTIADVIEVIEKYFETKAEKLEEMSKTMKTPETTLKDDKIAKMAQGFTPDYSEHLESFKDTFERERRERAGMEFRKFQERLKNLSFVPSEYTNFEPIYHPQNDYYNEESPHPLEG